LKGALDMRAFIKTFTVLFLLCFSVTGQTMNEELSRLREHLGLPADTPIKLATSSRLPDKTPLNVYVATGLDIKVRDKFAEWIEKWNKEEAKKLGGLEQVSDITQADIILSRYTLQEQVSTQTASSVGSATVYDPATNSTVTRPVTRTYSYNLVPVYLYMIERTDYGLNILWRETTRTSLGDFKSGGYSLRDEFKKMMQARAKNQKR
jgi:hypothetical protein